MNELEQPELLDSGSDAMIGKFKDAESLLKAYNNLEAEFTKKSQRLKALESERMVQQNESSRQTDIERRVDEYVSKFDFVRPFSSALKETLTADSDAKLEDVAMHLIADTYKKAEDYASDSEFLNNYIYSNKDIKDRIVRDYLSQITQNSPIKASSYAGAIPLTPPTVPTTIAEAGKLARNIIKQK